MTQSVYVIGGAGTGKSTFMSQLMGRALLEYGPLQDLFSLRNRKALVTLRGHPVYGYEGERGVYLGVIRNSFPGTDGLDRASSPVGEAWLYTGDVPGFVIGEGATLATRRFLRALADTTDLLLVHLVADASVKQERFRQRGSNQDPSFVEATATRAQNRYSELDTTKTRVNSTIPAAWSTTLDRCVSHLGLAYSGDVE